MKPDQQTAIAAQAIGEHLRNILAPTIGHSLLALACLAIACAHAANDSRMGKEVFLKACSDIYDANKPTEH